ncbi:MAG TPA: response regulator [Candidatus Lambdaproteobacteria bacterium]|jgi:DNA-binding NtrC family response regulator|uniref:Fis family transcriptional regulator n=1 Tax=SAR324 cluster bacterium TaxID=2024889 RepID=A0A432GHP6_9DELT|nr:response regulator [bacterium]RTZ81705.1 MAG: Fis family transcriptional regulator [SAR324 cluster bacterium]HIA34741.1 response regulator [Candidatus Lambdaproteobacteria bacterium]HIP63669.1 response regulator [Deltaproteobacteria bacterium]RTZ83322.1 MAG: Fis family transcriptional regulator [SAR324 cluster bacterium]
MKTTANSKLSILVVDDDENIRMVLRQSLEKEGYHVSTANSSEEALNTLQRSFFHVVITDIMMGEMNGVELLLQIKEMNSLMQIYVMTSHGTLPHVIQCMQGGAYDFFEKPLKIEDILISLGEAARRATRWSSLYSSHSLSAKGK